MGYTADKNLAKPSEVSISSGMRSALLHVQVGDNWNLTSLYKFGNYSYFSESALNMPDFKTRYWGDNYDRLETIRKANDENQRFYCRHCVGSDIPKVNYTWELPNEKNCPECSFF